MLTFEEVLSQILQLKLSEKSTLIGGQALNYWCGALESPELIPYEPFASKDVDFMGSTDDVLECARAFHVTAAFPKHRSTDPRCGWMEVPRDGEPLLIDFLHAPKGLTREEVEKYRVEVDGVESALWVMHPVHCMISRTCNVADLPDTYANEHGLKQLRASVVMLRRFILQTAEIKGQRDALRLCKRVFKFGLQPQALHVFQKHDVDVFDSAPKEGLGSTFTNTQRPRDVAQLRKARERYRLGPSRLV